MTGAEFITIAQHFTGTVVKACGTAEEALLNSMLKNESRPIDYSQFNELLLLVNKNRMGRPLYDYLFGAKATVAAIRVAVQRFQTLAMLRYGNFVFAYRTLCRISEEARFRSELGELLLGGSDIAKFKDRTDPLVPISEISRDDTPLVGYLSATTITAENVRGRFLLDVMEAQLISSWEQLVRAVTEMSSDKERPSIIAVIDRYRAGYPDETPTQFQKYLAKLVPVLEQRQQHLKDVQLSAARNQEIYLTWDHMDVYFATSMRKSWEYTDLYDFLTELMQSKKLRPLNIRHFDPTQSYADQRIDKGLVEALMLKRAKCTVYSVQDTDTLGKDSELAATLAQGKPVIAYVPTVDVSKRTNELFNEDPLTILDRLRFVLYADETLMSTLEPGDSAVIDNLAWLSEFERTRVFRSVRDEAQTKSLRKEHAKDLKRLCAIIATSEHRIYDSRARTLRDRHPLGIQVNLENGVANGVLVVRDARTCADLLSAILTKAMKFSIEQDEAAWYLRERISGCVFRVVTKNVKVSNCFWNFYLQR
jgi:hypothetical protein